MADQSAFVDRADAKEAIKKATAITWLDEGDAMEKEKEKQKKNWGRDQC